jgi:membrane protease YdiL (CAAX protease family)
MVIGALEEMLYRGAVYGGLRRSWDWRVALVFSSVVYAAAHFLRSAPSPAGEVHWWSGLALLLRMAEGFTRVEMLVPGFFCLLLAGMVLGLAYERTGSLWFSIGLHTGWVFWLRSYGYMTDRRPGVAEWWWGSGKLYDGCVAVVALALAGWCVFRLQKTPPDAPHDSPPA